MKTKIIRICVGESTWAMALILGLFLFQPTLGWAEKITLVVENDWPPYSSNPKNSDSPEGFSIELIRTAFATQNITVDFISVPFARCMYLAKTEKTVGCFNATATDDNRKQYFWHDPPLFYEDLSIFGRATADKSVMTLASLRGKQVGITNGYTYPTNFMHDVEIVKYTANSDASLIKMLLNNRVDYILLNRMPGYLRISQDPESRGKVVLRGKISTDAFWIAFSKAHANGERLAKTFSKGMREIKKNGTYKKMYETFQRNVINGAKQSQK
ncbi:MAG: transporter substrate-binding domain-containing protein [Bdellovibrionales bacterium]|nr:transporter substrate-binding domain-containing protein [Bdellovibrionales bacterium]